MDCSLVAARRMCRSNSAACLELGASSALLEGFLEGSLFKILLSSFPISNTTEKQRLTAEDCVCYFKQIWTPSLPHC